MKEASVQALRGKKAVVTGAGSGIGAGIARAFVTEGAEVFLSYNTARQAAEQLRDELLACGGAVWVAPLDLQDKPSITEFLRQAQATMKGMDILVNNAGADILTGSGASGSEDGKLQVLLDVDVRGTVHACCVATSLLQDRPGGTILNMAWDLALHGLAGRNAEMFAATKAGVLGYSYALARSVAPNIRVNVLAPGWIRTRFAECGMSFTYYQARVAEIPLARFGTVEDVARAAVFLCSDAASYITGVALRVNGGGHLTFRRG